MPDHEGESRDWVARFLKPPVDYDFSDEFSVTLPAHQWQLLLRASKHGIEHVTGLAQAYQEIAAMYRIARAKSVARPNYGSDCGHPQQPPTDQEIDGCPEIIVRFCPTCGASLWWNVDWWRKV